MLFSNLPKPYQTRQYQLHNDYITTICLRISLSNFPLPIPQSLEISTTIQVGYTLLTTTQIGYPLYLTTLITFHAIYRIPLSTIPHHSPHSPPKTAHSKTNSIFNILFFGTIKKTAIFQAVFYTFILNIYIQYIPDVFIRLNIYYLF